PKYSNLGIAILGYALTKIAGQPYEQFARERILQPLGMIDSGFERDQYGEDHFAVGYFAEGESMKQAMVWDANGFRPAGGMYSTVADISKFIALQFSDAPAGGSQILGSSSLREMHMPINVTQDFVSGFGLGFGIQRVAGLKVLGHSGGLPGYTTNISFVPQLKLGMIVFTNTGTEPIPITHRMLEVLIPAFRNQQTEPDATVEQIASWKPYMGRYSWMTMDDVLEIRMLNGKLTALTVGDDLSTYIKLTPSGEHRFKMQGGSSNQEEMRFEVDASGKITGLWLGGYPYRRLGDEE
ncbi:MAG: serine hydrolase domain-containing protein, partial [Chloroflexota bacterium]